MKIITVVQTFFRKSCRWGAIKGFLPKKTVIK